MTMKTMFLMVLGFPGQNIWYIFIFLMFHTPLPYLSNFFVRRRKQVVKDVPVTSPVYLPLFSTTKAGAVAVSRKVRLRFLFAFSISKIFISYRIAKGSI